MAAVSPLPSDPLAATLADMQHSLRLAREELKQPQPQNRSEEWYISHINRQLEEYPSKISLIKKLKFTFSWNTDPADRDTPLEDLFLSGKVVPHYFSPLKFYLIFPSQNPPSFLPLLLAKRLLLIQFLAAKTNAIFASYVYEHTHGFHKTQEILLPIAKEEMEACDREINRLRREIALLELEEEVKKEKAS